jgi:hypothetical protein
MIGKEIGGGVRGMMELVRGGEKAGNARGDVGWPSENFLRGFGWQRKI